MTPCGFLCGAWMDFRPFVPCMPAINLRVFAAGPKGSFSPLLTSPWSTPKALNIRHHATALAMKMPMSFAITRMS